jgi:hypothetical protein
MSSIASLSSLIAGSGLDDSAVVSMTQIVNTLGANINAGLGTIQVDDIGTSEVILLTEVLDDSTSMSGNAQEARDGHNLVLKSLRESKQQAAVLSSCWTLNRGVLYPYVDLSQAPDLDAVNYNPGGITPLYDTIAIVLTAVAAKVAEFEQAGVDVRAITYFTTDGADYGSTKKAREVKPIVEALLATEQHIIAGVGIEDHTTNFKSVFANLGLLPNWVLTPGNSPSEIRKAFNVVSQSAVRASQTASFSQTAMSGFGAP